MATHVDDWLSILRRDDNAFAHAAALARQACDCVMGSGADLNKGGEGGTLLGRVAPPSRISEVR
ncbi:MAG: hypothetical protein LJE70_00010 [Chromatiaceae bacterium]|nr:hypothetical protein [Chromatiaceae bacterium]